MRSINDVSFQEYSVKTEDPDGDEHVSKVRAFEVDKDSSEFITEVATPLGTRRVREGDVLVETSRPDVYEVLTKNEWKDTGYSTGDPGSANATPSEDGPAPDTAEGSSDTNPRKTTARR